MSSFWQKSSSPDELPVRKPGDPYRVMFVCIGNSCRSPMAEGFARARHPEVIEAFSSGVGPAPIIQLETYTVMQETGITLEGQYPKYIAETPYNSMDLIIDMARMPLVPRLPNLTPSELMPTGPVEWLVPDPIGREVALYRQVRDDIERRVAQLADQLRARD